MNLFMEALLLRVKENFICIHRLISLSYVSHVRLKEGRVCNGMT